MLSSCSIASRPQHRVAPLARLALMLWTLVVLALQPCAFAGPREEDFEAERAGAARELLTGLTEYAEWCSDKKLWVERNRALEAVLALDPANLAAKRGLGWVQVADGVWEPAKDRKPPKNYDPGALKEAPERYAAAVRPWRERLMALVEQHAATLTPFQRESVYAELLSVDPDDAYARGARGEVKGPRGWVLEKTLVAKARRAEVRALVQGALAAVPAPVDVEPEAQDLNYQVPWRASVGTDRVRVFTTGERAEALRAVQVLHASRDVFDGLLGVHVDLGEVLRVYLLCDPASKAAFLEHIPDLSAERRAFYAQLEGTGIGPANAAWWAPSPERRLDGIVRHVLGASLTAEFGLTVDTAWAWEGLGLYLTRELVGTRLTWYVRQTETGGTVAARGVQVDWTKKLQTPGTNWMNEGYRLLRARETLGLGAVLTRPLNKLTPEDLFVAYVVGAYLIEAEAAELPNLLRTLGGKHRPAQAGPAAIQGALGLGLEAFHGRLTRWLKERR